MRQGATCACGEEAARRERRACGAAHHELVALVEEVQAALADGGELHPGGAGGRLRRLQRLLRLGLVLRERRELLHRLEVGLLALEGGGALGDGGVEALQEGLAVGGDGLRATEGQRGRTRGV